jgi:hypothetical protein
VPSFDSSRLMDCTICASERSHGVGHPRQSRSLPDSRPRQEIRTRNGPRRAVATAVGVRFGATSPKGPMAGSAWLLRIRRALPERDVDSDVHDDHFPGQSAPLDVSEGASEPISWSASAVRNTGVQNVGR